MKNIAIIFVLLFTFILGACNNINSNTPKVTEEEAKQIVLEHHTKEIRKVEIISVSRESDIYIIEWENDENCEKGTDSVSNEDGEIEMIEASIC